MSHIFGIKLSPSSNFMICFDNYPDSLEQVECIIDIAPEIESSMPNLSCEFEPMHDRDSYSFETINNKRSKASIVQVIPLDIRDPGSVDNAILVFEKCVRVYKAIKPYILGVEPPEREL